MSQLSKAKQQFNNVENIFVLPMELDSVFRWTPLGSWWEEEFQYLPSPWRTIHLADAARLALLWKYGGLYMDTDALTIKPFFDR